MKLKEVNSRILEGLSDEEKQDFERGLKLLEMDSSPDREALRESARKAWPNFSESQLDIFVAGRFPPVEASGTLKESFIRLGYSEKQAEIATSSNVKNLGYSSPGGGSDREALIASLKRIYPDWTDAQIEVFVKGR